MGNGEVSVPRHNCKMAIYGGYQSNQHNTTWSVYRQTDYKDSLMKTTYLMILSPKLRTTYNALLPGDSERNC